MCTNNWRATGRATLGLMLALAFVGSGVTKSAQAQTFHVIHSFSGGQDGGNPYTGLTIDAGGNFYGTAFSGGSSGFGTVFSLTSSGSGWLVNPLHSFAGGNDGAGPVARLVIGPDGALYGSTSAGGGANCVNYNGNAGCGIVYELRPPLRSPASAIAYWNSNILYRFSGSDGAYPEGDLTFDQAGNIYGTTINGGSAGWGVVYSLSPSGGGWTQKLLYQVQNNGDGQYAWGGVTFDASGNLYGVFSQGGPGGYGALYKLTPSGHSWTESTVHGFTFHGNDGATPEGGLIRDAAGNLYGTTVHDSTGGGTIFKLTPSGGNWSFDFLYGLTGGIDLGPYDKLVMDGAGNLYGTTFADGQYGYGSVFKLTHSGNGWTYTTLHDFTNGSDGSNPMCALVVDSSGNLYGTASGGGSNNNGVIFQITP
jgi:uncharacterized repeat protein (TIGR03803 family)